MFDSYYYDEQEQEEEAAIEESPITDYQNNYEEESNLEPPSLSTYLPDLDSEEREPETNLDTTEGEEADQNRGKASHNGSGAVADENMSGVRAKRAVRIRISTAGKPKGNFAEKLSGKRNTFIDSSVKAPEEENGRLPHGAKRGKRSVSPYVLNAEDLSSLTLMEIIRRAETLENIKKREEEEKKSTLFGVCEEGGRVGTRKGKRGREGGGRDGEGSEQTSGKRVLITRDVQKWRRGGHAAPSSLSSSLAPSLAPQVRVVDGRIVLDESSLSAPQSSSFDSPGADVSQYTRVDESTSKLNYHSYANFERGEKWKREETELWYKALSQFGSDFSLLQQLFPHRTRNQIKKKFQKESSLFPNRVSDAMSYKNKDLSHYESLLREVDRSLLDKVEEEKEKMRRERERDRRKKGVVEKMLREVSNGEKEGESRDEGEGRISWGEEEPAQNDKTVGLGDRDAGVTSSFDLEPRSTSEITERPLENMKEGAEMEGSLNLDTTENAGHTDEEVGQEEEYGLARQLGRLTNVGLRKSEHEGTVQMLESCDIGQEVSELSSALKRGECMNSTGEEDEREEGGERDYEEDGCCAPEEATEDFQENATEDLDPFAYYC